MPNNNTNTPNIYNTFVEFVDSEGRVVKASIWDIIHNGPPWDNEVDEEMAIWTAELLDEGGKTLDSRPEKT